MYVVVANNERIARFSWLLRPWLWGNSCCSSMLLFRVWVDGPAKAHAGLAAGTPVLVVGWGVLGKVKRALDIEVDAMTRDHGSSGVKPGKLKGELFVCIYLLVGLLAACFPLAWPYVRVLFTRALTSRASPTNRPA